MLIKRAVSSTRRFRSYGALAVCALAILLTACSGEGIRRRLEGYVPAFFPIKETVYFETGLRGCAVAIFALEDGFSTHLALHDANPLNAAARHRRNNTERSKADYPSWRKTPIAPYEKIESEPLFNVMPCLYEPKQHEDLFLGVMDTRSDAYFTTQNGFDLVVYVPARNIVIVSSYR